MEDTAQLGIKPATQNPRVINYMDEIIAFVSIIIIAPLSIDILLIIL